MGLIYIIRNTVNEKVYIGQTTQSLGTRWWQHKKVVRNYQKFLVNHAAGIPPKKGVSRTKLCLAMNKHGIEQFRIEILQDNIEKDLLDEMEIKYIKEFNSVNAGYNTQIGGQYKPGKVRTAMPVTAHADSFAQFRKHDEILNDLPIHCIYLQRKQTVSVAINKHPLCNRKEFSVRTYGSLDDAKKALIEYLTELEKNKVPVAKVTKKDPTLPKGVNKIKNCYFVDKTVKGTTYRKAFSGSSDEENKANAIAYLQTLIN